MVLELLKKLETKIFHDLDKTLISMNLGMIELDNIFKNNSLLIII